MLEFPKLKSYLSVFPISETTWGLRGGPDQVWRVKLRNQKAMEAFGGLLPYLTGKHSVEDIVDILGARGIERAPILAVLGYLARTRLIEEGRASALEPEETERYGGQVSFFSRFASSGGAAFQARLGECAVAVTVDGPLGWMVCRQLVEAGLGRVDAHIVGPENEGEGPAWARDPDIGERLQIHRDPIGDGFSGRLMIVPQERHDSKQLQGIDELSRRNGVPWLLLRALDADEGWVGPLFVPGETAALASLQARLDGNNPFFQEERVFDRHLAEGEETAAPAGGLLPFLELLAALAATEAVKFLSEVRSPSLLGRFLTVDLWDWNIESHEVLRVPGLEPAPSSGLAVFPWKAAGSDGNS